MPPPPTPPLVSPLPRQHSWIPDSEGRWQKSPIKELPNHWSEVIDPPPSRAYFYNSQTGESRWSYPPLWPGAPEVEDAWEERESEEEVGEFYYYNRVSGESRWDEPEDIGKGELKRTGEDGTTGTGEPAKNEAARLVREEQINRLEEEEKARAVRVAEKAEEEKMKDPSYKPPRSRRLTIIPPSPPPPPPPRLLPPHVPLHSVLSSTVFLLSLFRRPLAETSPVVLVVGLCAIVGQVMIWGEGGTR